MRKEKRAISPVVATVLLIVIAIALFLLIFLWLRGFEREAILKYQKPIETVCNDLHYEVTRSGDTLQIKNLGSVTIHKAAIFVDGKLNQTTSQLWPASSWQTTLRCTGKIKVVPYLLGSTSRGTKEYACEKQAKIISC